MSSATIPLMVQTPQPISPLQSAASLMQIRDSLSQIALRNQQTAAAAANAQDLQAQAAQRQRTNAGWVTLQGMQADPETNTQFHLGNLSAAEGKVPPDVLAEFGKQQVDYKKSLLAQGSDQLKLVVDSLGQVASTINGLKDLVGEDGNLDAVNAALPGATQHLQSIGALKNAGITAPLPTTLTDPKQLDMWLSTAGAAQAAHQQALDLKLKQEQAGEAGAKAGQANADAVQARAQAAHLTATLPKDQADAEIAKLNAEFAAKHGGLTPEQNEGARHNKASEAVQAGELGLKQKTFEATLGSGLDANGQPMAPEAMKQAALQDPTAVAIAHYQLAPPPAQTRGGLPSPILRKVLAINPQYDATTYPARAETAKGFSPSGQQGQAITAADTALAHLNTLSAAGKALDNGDVQVINRVANAIGAQVGATPKATYDTILNMVGPEISKAVIGAVGGEGERAGTAANFTSNLSPAQRESNIGAAVGLLGARFDKASHAYESEMGVPLPRSLSPESQAIRQHYSGGGSSVPRVTTKAQFDALPSGSVYTEADGKQYRKP